VKPFSKKLLTLDYIITAILICVLFVCVGINGFYTAYMTNELISKGMEVYSITPPLSLDVFGIILSAWIGQLAISSGSYYMMSKSDHKIQLPMAMLNTMPDEIKDQLDMTQVVTTVLSTTDN